MELADAKKWLAVNAVFDTRLVHPNQDEINIISQLIAAVESLTAEKEAALKNLSMFAMSEPTLIKELRRERDIAESSLAQAREEIGRLKVDCECHRIQAVDRGNSFANMKLRAEAAEQHEKGLIDRLHNLYECRYEMDKLLILVEQYERERKAALAAASTGGDKNA